MSSRASKARGDLLICEKVASPLWAEYTCPAPAVPGIAPLPKQAARNDMAKSDKIHNNPTMNTKEAKQILSEELETYQVRAYADLAQSVDQTFTCAKKGASGEQYQLEVLVSWDSKTDGAIRVIGSIDDGGWRAFSPITDSVLVDADKPK